MPTEYRRALNELAESEAAAFSPLQESNMGKPTGFLELDRQDRGYLPKEERVQNFREFVVPLAEPELKAQASRCMDCGVPYCHNGCPVNNQIPDWNDFLYRATGKRRCRICIRRIISRNLPAAFARPLARPHAR
jgi:ferredoxin